LKEKFAALPLGKQRVLNALLRKFERSRSGSRVSASAGCF